MRVRHSVPLSWPADQSRPPLQLKEGEDATLTALGLLEAQLARMNRLYRARLLGGVRKRLEGKSGTPIMTAVCKEVAKSISAAHEAGSTDTIARREQRSEDLALAVSSLFWGMMSRESPSRGGRRTV
jgi:hypothetical protein